MRPQLGLNGSYGAQSSEFGRTVNTPSGSFPLDGSQERATSASRPARRSMPAAALAAQRDQAQAGVDAAEADLRGAEQNLVLDVVSAFVDVRRAEQEVAIRETNVTSLGQQVQAARDRFDVGEVTRTDVAQAEAREAGAEADLAAVARRAGDSARQLRADRRPSASAARRSAARARSRRARWMKPSRRRAPHNPAARRRPRAGSCSGEKASTSPRAACARASASLATPACSRDLPGPDLPRHQCRPRRRALDPALSGRPPQLAHATGAAGGGTRALRPHGGGTRGHRAGDQRLAHTCIAAREAIAASISRVAAAEDRARRRRAGTRRRHPHHARRAGPGARTAGSPAWRSSRRNAPPIIAIHQLLAAMGGCGRKSSASSICASR